MATAPLFARPGSEFDAFLFAPVGDEGSGHPLSVISALARLNLDPWQEAVSLSNLPTTAATQRLTSLIAALPSGLANHFVPAAIAMRLAGLLPRRMGDSNAATVMPDAGGKEKLMSMFLMGGVLVLVVLGSQWVASNKEAPAKVDSPVAQSSSAVVPTVPLSH